MTGLPPSEASVCGASFFVPQNNPPSRAGPAKPPGPHGVTSGFPVRSPRPLPAAVRGGAAQGGILPDGAGAELPAHSGPDAPMERGAPLPAGLCQPLRGLDPMKKRPLSFDSGRVFRIGRTCDGEMNRGSADAAQHGSGHQGDEAHGDEEIPQILEPLAHGFLGAVVDFFHGLLAGQDHEEHDGRQSRAQGADVDGNHVHPLGGPGLDQQGHDHADDADDAHGGKPLQLELLLHGGHGCLIQVDDGADAREEDRHIEDDADDPSAGHPVEDVDQIHEHQAGAGVHVAHGEAGSADGRDDDEGGQQSSQGVEQGHATGGGGDVLILGQIGAVNHGAVARHGQGEEGLTEGVNPHLEIQQALGVQSEQELVTLGSAGLEANVDSQDDKQAEQDGHHDFVGLFDSVGHAHGHDDHRHYQADDQPHAVADAEDSALEHHADGLAQGGGLRSRAAEGAADGAHVLAHGVQAAGEGHEGVLEDPAHDHGVADGQHHGADDGDEADGLAQLPVAVSGLGGVAEGVNGTRLGPAAQSELLHDAGVAHQQDDDEVGDQEGQAAPAGHHDGEAPDVAHADGGADAGQNKAPLALKSVAGLQGLIAHNRFLLFLSRVQHTSSAVWSTAEKSPRAFLPGNGCR